MLCPEIHGDSGLDGPDGGRLLSRSPKQARQGKAVTAMFEAIKERHAAGTERVRLVCIGALTNVALLITLFPEVMPMVEIVIMGGCLGIGNTGPVMEFNMQVRCRVGAVTLGCDAKCASHRSIQRQRRSSLNLECI